MGQPRSEGPGEETHALDKKAVVHLHNGILLSHKKKKLLPFVTGRIDLGNITLSEISQSEKDRYHMISVICGI